MVFSSMTFLVLFLPIIVILYYCLPSIRLKNGLLIFASLLFYALGEPIYILLLLVSCFLNYKFAQWISKSDSKNLLIICVVLNLGFLFVFKYLSFFIESMNLFGLSLPVPELRLPIGISFYTFQALSYVIDVYRREENSASKFNEVLLYISLFPQLIAGPILKYHDVAKQITSRMCSVDKIAEGIKLFSFGLAKKVVVSNNLAIVVDSIFQMKNHELNGAIAWIGAIFYTLQIYYDFSGYSDMALGLGKMLGFEFEINFNYPYAATTMKEFWRRWHMSLSSWFKEYLYIPLGGNRISSKRTLTNKVIVFFCTGLWHGANYTFIFWGMMNGLLTCLEEKGSWTKKIKGSVIGWVYTFLCTVLCFTMFRSENFSQAIVFYKNMFFGILTNMNNMTAVIQYMNPYTIFVFIIACLGIFNWKKIKTKLEVLSYPWSIVCLLFSIMTLATNGYNPFIYFRF